MPATEQPEQAPRQVSEEARRFLAAIGREPPYLFRALPDPKDKKGKPGYPAHELAGSFDDHAQQLRRLNDAGYGIFVQIDVADGKGWRANNIVAATCLFADFDGVPLEAVERLALAPHVAVETSPGKRHYYWRVDDLPIDQHQALQQRLIGLFGSDKSVHDKPRIMRLPGFLHQKDPDTPYLARVIETRDAPPYPIEAFLAALADGEQKHVPTKPAASKLPESVAAPSARQPTGELRDTESMLRHLIGLSLLDLADRSEWIKVGIAIKSSHGEDGFPLWVQLSSEAEGFDGEDACAKQWRSFKEDRPDDKKLTTASFFKIALEHGWKRPRGGDGMASDEPPEGGRAGGGKVDPALVAIEQANQAGDERFLDTDGEAYVRFCRKAGDPNSPKVVTRINSELYAGVLRRRFHLEAVTKTLGKDQLNNAVALLQAEARENDVVRPVYLRCGAHDGRVYVDLGRRDGAAVEVDAAGWRVITETPVMFVRGSRGELPEPAPGGTLADLERHMPSLDRAGVQRVLGFAIGTFMQGDDPTYPLLMIEGPYGSNKSTVADMVLAVTDPPAGRKDARFSFSTDERDLLIHASNARVLFFHNVSNFDSKSSDILCKLLGGTAFSTRMLHTNSDEQLFRLRRPVVVTCIGSPSTRGDLLDRVLPVMTQSGGVRRTEAAVWAAFSADRATIFGLVLTGVSLALRNAAAIQAMVDAGELTPPRLADLAQWVEGAAAVLDLPTGAFSAMLSREQAGLQSEAAAGDPLGQALVRYLSVPGNDKIEASSAELLALLTNGSAERQRGWPSAANKVPGHIERIAPGLREVGIEVTAERVGGKYNRIRFTISCNDGFEAIKLPDSEHF